MHKSVAWFLVGMSFSAAFLAAALYLKIATLVAMREEAVLREQLQRSYLTDGSARCALAEGAHEPSTP